MIEKIKEYFIENIQLAEEFENILIDFIGDEAITYTIEPVPVEPIIRPYTDSDVKIVKNYYNYQGTEDEQKESIIYYEDTYMPSSGVSYGKDEEFDVVAILDGKVTKVSNDDTVGNIMEMYDAGFSIIEISKVIGLGVSEVKFIIDKHQGDN